MEKLIQPKKVLKLSDNDKRILLAYANAMLEGEAKPTMEATAHEDLLRVS